MQGILNEMAQLHFEIRSSGAYFILLLVSLYILFRINKKKNSGYILYTILVIVFVCMNPLLVYVLSRAFPVLASYRIFTLLIPVLLVVPVALTELMEQVRDFKKNVLLLFLTVIIIGLSGTVFGIYKENRTSRQILTVEEQNLIEYVVTLTPELVVADEELIPFFRTYGEQNISLLYGRDLYQPNMDLGIIDVYPEELLGLYEAIKNPKDTIQDIIATAELYGCDVVVLKQYDDVRDKVGHFSVVKETENYLVYQKMVP